MKKNSKILKILAVVVAIIIVVAVFVWKELNKTPDEYSYEEYDKMTPEERLEFQESFESFEDFDNWVRENIE